MKLIEYAIATENSFSPTVILIDCGDISSFEQIKGVSTQCKIITKSNQSYIAYGTYKTVTNRFFYALSKKNNIYEDDIIRPSIRVFHRPNTLEPDVAFFDPLQLKAFIYGLDPNFPLEKLPEYTKSILSEMIN